MRSGSRSPAAWRSELEAPLGAIDDSKININGGALSTGHRFAATGGQMLAGLAKELAQRDRGRGLISICAAGGLGVAASIER